MRRLAALAAALVMMTAGTAEAASSVSRALAPDSPRPTSRLDTLRAAALAHAGPAAAAPTGTMPLGGVPFGEALDPSTHTLYVTDIAGSTVAVIDTSACNGTDAAGCGQPVARIEVGPGPVFPAIDATRHTLYVPLAGFADDGHQVSVVDTSACNAQDTSGCAGALDAQIDTGTLAVFARVDPAHATVYVAAPLRGVVFMIDERTCSALATGGCGHRPAKAATGTGPDALGVDREHHTVYVSASGEGVVTLLDTDTCNAMTTAGCAASAHTFGAGFSPFYVTVDEASDTVYVPNFGDNHVTMINTRTCNAERGDGCDHARAATTGGWPLAVAIDHATHTAYVSILAGSVVSVLDASTCNGHTTAGCRDRQPDLRVGRSPNDVVVDPDHGTIYTADYADGTVSAVDMRHCSAQGVTGCRRLGPTMPVGTFPFRLAADPTQATVYVAQQAQLSMIDTAACNHRNLAGCAQRPLTTPMAAPFDIAPDPAHHTLYVTNFFSGEITMVDDRTCNAHDQSGCGRHVRVNLGADTLPATMALNSRTHTLYVLLIGSLEIAALDTKMCNIADRSGCGATLPRVGPIGSSPYQMEVNRNTNTLYVSDFSVDGNPGSDVFVIDGRRCSAIDASGCASAARRFFLGAYPGGIAVDETTDTLYMTYRNFKQGDLGLVAVIDGLTCNGQDRSGCTGHHPTVGVGYDPLDAVIDPHTHTLFVNNGFGSTVSIADVSACNRTTTTGCGPAGRTAEVGSLPHYETFDPGTGTAYVSNLDSANISIVGRR